MEFIISFFRDVIDGWWYVLFIFVCLFFVLVAIGMYGDKKREAIAKRLKEKKARDIASGKEARIAALESKQVLDVMEGDLDNPESSTASETTTTDNSELTKKEEAPSVLVIGDSGSSNAPTLEPSLETQQEKITVAQEPQKAVVEQVVQPQSSVQVQQSNASNNNAVSN